MFLFQQIDSIRDFSPIAYKELPDVISDNLNSAFELRPYQIDAFRNFITFYESDKCPNPTQVLFHMATGSGKTLIMAGLIVYLYRHGYRNFLFFVNLDNIVKKTKDNFLNAASAKYLFSEQIVIGGETVKVNEVSNFQGANPDAINICFTTTQGLHSDMWFPKENSPSFDDFTDSKTVLIADEAHHLNVDTRRGKVDKNEETSTQSWETTVHRIFSANRDNILLEFTATCDLQNPYILREYENKIIFDYPLRKFREEKYSKQVRAIRADISYTDRALQALMFSQYRLKVFQDHRIYIKPVVLFKAKTIAESKDFEQTFYEMMRTLSGSILERIVTSSPLAEVKRMTDYFFSKDIDFVELAQELKEEFSPDHCISVNDDKEAIENQIILNSLESRDNPYRAIFEVKKLDEGWDVLNLFDIVRLYETRDASKGKPGSATIAEAQLIGRGARYCPYVINEDDEKYKRKYDSDIDNPLRVCEELYYHCQYDSRYIDELNKALIASGIMPESQTEIHYLLKDSFKQDDIYKTGIVFLNRRELKSRRDIVELLPSMRDKEYTVTVDTGKTTMDTMMMNAHTNTTVKTHTHRTTIGKIAEYNYSIVHSAMRRIDVFKFNVLRSYFPNLKSLREFIIDASYLGGVKMLIESRNETPSPETLFLACMSVLTKIGGGISSIKETYEGTTDFTDKKINEVFRNKTIHITDPHGEGVGISQNAPSIRPEWKVNLRDMDWFIFNDNFGTTEEKAFVAYFSTYVEELKKEYEKVYLVRNERQLVLYSFNGGERFEPDYLMFLCKRNATGFEQYQIFVEPKGNHLIAQDKWKEDFLLQIENRGIPKKTFADDNKYFVWGFPFYNQQNRMTEFSKAFESVLSDSTGA
ncbi:type III restriction enzyme [Cohnella sp. OV330]|uniref:DEAD/DEAH box helicase family protein n=1 Tax=Cohnella sp. OV330 TaxID=1855288 RepID=UPI0008E2F2F8|nr:DEAD/DEAH box helicase family protein [Cohnella sp. OV330]SFA75479.1 type III restriction enzyme [Cohnella sp. OV330]